MDELYSKNVYRNGGLIKYSQIKAFRAVLRGVRDIIFFIDYAIFLLKIRIPQFLVCLEYGYK